MSALLLTCVSFLTGCDDLKATFDRKGYLEDQSVSLVTDLMRRQDVDARCLKVKITQEMSGKNCRGKATLDTGEEIDVVIEDRDDTIWAEFDLESESTIEVLARPLVTEIMREKGGAKCIKVDITDKVDSTHFRGKAELSDGSERDIAVEVRGKVYEVSVL